MSPQRACCCVMQLGLASKASCRLPGLLRVGFRIMPHPDVYLREALKEFLKWGILQEEFIEGEELLDSEDDMKAWIAKIVGE